MNNGQLVKIIRDQFLIDAVPLNKIKGVPFTKGELVEAIRQYL
jgi:2-oxoglutarate ferredoxin oxidoreductase subunit alpha